MKVRHEGISFNFKGVGKWYETESKEEIERLVEKYPGLEIEQNGIVVKRTRPAPMPMIDPIEDLNNHIDQTSSPITYDRGWYTYHGKKYRKANLPPEALALIEE